MRGFAMGTDFALVLLIANTLSARGVAHVDVHELYFKHLIDIEVRFFYKKGVFV
jgi:hypothetical protein